MIRPKANFSPTFHELKNYGLRGFWQSSPDIGAKVLGRRQYLVSITTGGLPLRI